MSTRQIYLDQVRELISGLKIELQTPKTKEVENHCIREALFNLETADGPQVILPHNSGNHSIAMPEGASIPEADITITLDTRGRPSNNVSLTYESNKYSPGVTITFNSITGFITIEYLCQIINMAML